MEAQLKGAVLIALAVVPQWRCPILKPLSAKLPPKSETAPHPGWQDGTILGLGRHQNIIKGPSKDCQAKLSNCGQAAIKLTKLSHRQLRLNLALSSKIDLVSSSARATSIEYHTGVW